jgi:DNA-binding response OmpR family regulator
MMSCKDWMRGADDYLTKPFDPAILKARVRALVRRVDSLKLNHLEELELGFIKLNIPRHEVSIRGEPVHLTPQ